MSLASSSPLEHWIVVGLVVDGEDAMVRFECPESATFDATRCEHLPRPALGLASSMFQGGQVRLIVYAGRSLGSTSRVMHFHNRS